ncbi:DUF4231 domain-containing protein [Protofrankia symbiont of Coriaria ruscifolia]|uniref:SMODS and SLOG-associating 2TM effector domain-containing protein n=1 Tax=Candidatus Protofrankia californiensis TaxID=1839754 RepID=A0A1C3NX69_9ACTN|nr:DUF4231 domain-containing protein [Protofrankia symbiont of Coriaria ruscifolia]SBW21928.1 hypothetical protein FDG2_2172 [Candidatus Protofrankia californiensis]
MINNLCHHLVVTSMASLGPAQRLLKINEEILRKEAELRNSRFTRRVARICTAVGPATLIAVYIATALTWRTVDLRLINFILIPFGSLAVSTATFIYWTTFTDDSVKSVAELDLDLSVLRERKRIQAAELMLDSRYRRSGYREEITPTLTRYRRESTRYRRIHNYLQACIIIGSLATTTLAGISVDTVVFRWATAGSSFFVGIAAGFTGYYKFRERSFHLQQTADAIEQEWKAFELSIGRYKNLTDDEALADFVEEIEQLKAEQRKREQNLDQPSERESATSRAAQ